MRRILSLRSLVFGFLVLLPAGASQAIPRFSARYEQNCGLCHVNPSGDGQRTLYAAQFIVPSEMAMRSPTAEQLAQIDPQLGKNVTVGLDLRTMEHLADHSNIPYQNFLFMEGSVDLAFQPDPRFLAYISKGLSTTTEAYGLLYCLPYSGYVKAGWFQPAFGWRFDDHTAFVMQKKMSASNSVYDLDGAPAPYNDVGVELAIFPQRLALTVATLNGDMGSNLDNNNQAAYCAQGLYRFNVRGVGAGIGGSIWRNLEPTGRHTSEGPYGYLTWKRATWLAESDWSRLYVSNGSGGATSFVTMWAVSQELSVLIRKGIEFRATYDFLDPNIYAVTGDRVRYGAGFDIIPYPYLDIQTMVNAHHFKLGSDVPTGQDYTQLEIQLHFFY